MPPAMKRLSGSFTSCPSSTGMPCRATVARDVRVLVDAREGDILADAHPVDAEGGVDAQGPPLEPVVRRGPILIEVVEGHVVRVILTAARDAEVGVRERRGTEHGLPPVRPGAAPHNQ